MLPGKTYSPDEIVRVVLRRKWLIVIPFLLITTAAVAVTRRMPNIYRSETLIMIVPQRIPDSYVKMAVTAKIEDRLSAISPQILSRSRLERIIMDLDLYGGQRRTVALEDIVSRMRADIDVKVEKGDAFRVTYVNEDPKTAQKVTERLASLFIEENLRDRENLAVDTNQFLDSQLADAKRRLEENEKKLEEYRKRYSGQLPSQASSNLQVIQSAQLQLQTLAEATARASERRLLLERQLADVQAPDPLLAVARTPAGADGGVVVESTAQQLESAKQRLRALELHDTPDHPDVRMLKRTIHDVEAKLEAESKNTAASGGEEKALTPAEALRQKRARDLTAQIADIDRELQDKQQQDKRLRAVIADYQGKVDAVPTRESELVELTRDYTTLQTTYQTLLGKREDSKIAANLERRNIGEQFKVLDPARVPGRPFSPDRLKLNGMAAAAGLLIGVGLVGFLEYRDSSFKVQDDVVRVLGLPVLAMVPSMPSRDDRTQQTRRRRLAVVAVAMLVVLLGSAVVVIKWRMQL